MFVLSQRGQASGATARGTKRSGDACGEIDRSGRRDAVAAQLGRAFGADPVARPGRRALHADPRRAEAGAVERGDDARLDHLGRRAARIGRRRRRRRARRRRSMHVADDAEVDDRDDRHLGIEHGREHRPGVLDARAAGRAPAAAPAAPCRTRRRSSPHAARKRALQVLHLGQHVAEVLAVAAASCRCCGTRARPAARGRRPRARRRTPARQSSRRSAQRGPRPRRVGRRRRPRRPRTSRRCTATAASSAAFRRAADSSVPSPRRTTQSAACSRW